MAKGYWIGHITIQDASRYPDYQAAAQPAYEKYGARFIARGGQSETVEGELGERHVIVEFDSLDAARACYESDTYAEARAIRQAISTGALVIVEGAD